MLGRLSGFSRRYPVPLGYLAALSTMSVVYAYALSAGQQQSLVAWASTNLGRLPANPVGTLVVSAFISQNTVLVWLVVGSLAFFPLARRFGNLGAAALMVGGHLLGTALSQGLTAWRLSVGAVPDAVRWQADVGPSYVVAAALVAVILYGPDRLSRALALVGWAALVPSLFEGLTSLEVSAVGHLVAMFAGALIGATLKTLGISSRRRTPSVGPATAQHVTDQHMAARHETDQHMAAQHVTDRSVTVRSATVRPALEVVRQEAGAHLPGRPLARNA